MGKMFHFTVLMFSEMGAVTVTNPGVAYVEDLAIRSRVKVDFTKFDSVNMRVVVTAQGNEAGVGKGIEIYDITGAAQLCEVVWDGNAVQEALAGSWTTQNAMTVDSVLTIRIKASSGTEDIDVLRVELQLMYH